MTSFLPFWLWIGTLISHCWLAGYAQALQVNIVLDGVVYEEDIRGDLCSIVEAVDNAIMSSTMPFSSISAVPEQWTVYLNNKELPTAECEDNNEVLESFNIGEGEHIYAFRNHLAYNDPYYAAEYVKMFSTSFCDRIRPLPQDGSSKKKKKSKSKVKAKKRFPKNTENDLLLQSVGALARTFILGSFSKGFEGENISEKQKVDAVRDDNHEHSKRSDADFKGQIDVLTGILSAIGKPMLESYMRESKELQNEEL